MKGSLPVGSEENGENVGVPSACDHRDGTAAQSS